MQHLSALLALLLVAVASAAPSQPVEQSSPIQSGSSVPVSVGNSPAQAPVVAPVSSIEAPQPSVGVVEHSVHQAHHQAHHQLHDQLHHSQAQHDQLHHSQAQPGYYAPAAGIIQVVGSEQPKPAGAAPVVRSAEQYGQPESASLPANYKPFGSWGLYIGGNPADGYYTNYYKALSNSVDQQQAGEQVKPTAALSPILRQASSSPYVGGDYYPFAYSPADLNSGARVSVEPAHSPVSPVQAGAQVYGAPSSFDTSYHYANQVSPYADAYATKKLGSAYSQQREVAPVKELPSVKEAAPAVQAPLPQAPSKGYQSRVYVYPPVGTLSAPLASPVQPHGHHYAAPSHQVPAQQAQVIAYPVPVGSQIVGSQQGVEGAFSPYGIHAFTRYAVKPTVVSHDASYYYGVQSVQQPTTYKQQHVSHAPVSTSQAGYYPFGFYGYPLSQLHYSQDAIVPQADSHFSHQHQHQHQHPHVHQAAPGSPFSPSVDKAESEENKPVIKPVSHSQQ